MHIAFTGQVSLPPGQWEVGIVQNCWNDRVGNVYSAGGEFAFSLNRLLLDVTIPADIWLDTLGNGVARFSHNSPGDQRFRLDLDAGDTATSPPIPGRQTRCNGTITEQLVFAERVLQLVAAIVARRDCGRRTPRAPFPLDP